MFSELIIISIISIIVVFAQVISYRVNHEILCFQVQVKSLDGTRIGIDLKGSATLADLKGLLHKNLGLPKSDQRFALVGQILDDTR